MKLFEITETNNAIYRIYTSRSMKKYDIFISYRREGGFDTAKHLNDLLTRDGYRVSFDIDTLRSGDFDTQLYERIDNCKDFILIVDEHAFDRTIKYKIPPQKDWLRCELARALEKKKNIIPIFLSGVKGFPNGLPKDISGVVKKNGPEYNRYYFNDFYRELKKRFLHDRPVAKKNVVAFIFSCVFLSVLFLTIFKYNNHQSDTYPSIAQAVNNISEDTFPNEEREKHEISKESILKKYCGSFSIVAPGYMKDGITWVYNLELDPINSKCEWIEDDFIHIVDSKGYCGTSIKGTEAWEIYTFNLRNDLKYAVADMRRVDETYRGENKTCKVKLELDEYDNIKMSFITGNAAPSPLYDSDGGFNETAIFNRD